MATRARFDKFGDLVADFPHFDYSRKQVERMFRLPAKWVALSALRNLSY